MIRTQIQLTEKQARLLKKMSARLKVSAAELIRRSIDRTLSDDAAPSEDELYQRAVQAVGRFHDTADDVSENHDRYLAEASRQ